MARRCFESVRTKVSVLKISSDDKDFEVISLVFFLVWKAPRGYYTTGIPRGSKTTLATFVGDTESWSFFWPGLLLPATRVLVYLLVIKKINLPLKGSTKE